MNNMFSLASFFNGDISKWDVSNARSMHHMFWSATSFNCDISKWDVSKVTDMNSMFASTNFASDISEWDVSKVTNMDRMFMNAASFHHRLCGIAWLDSMASKMDMFWGSSGSISRYPCRSSRLSQRWLARWQMQSAPNASSSTMTPGIALESEQCEICGTFKKFGRKSCCAPGGSWYKQCGDVNSGNADHTWLQGTEACKRKSMLW